MSNGTVSFSLALDIASMLSGFAKASRTVSGFKTLSGQLAPMKLDTAQVRAGLAQAREAMTDFKAAARNAGGVVRIDTSKIAAPLAEAKAKLNALARTAAASLALRTEKFTAPLQMAKAKLQGLARSAGTSLNLHTARFTAPLADARAKLQTLAKTATVALVANTARFTAPIAQARARLQTLARTATVTLQANTARLIAPINPGALAKVKNQPGIERTLRTAKKSMRDSAAPKGAAVDAAQLQAGAARARAQLATLKAAVPALRPTLDTSLIASGVGKAKGMIGSLGSSIGKVLGPLALIGLSFEAFRSVEGFVSKFKEVVATGKELRTLSLVTGTTISDLVVLRKAFDDVGIGSDSVQQNLVMMQKALGGINENGEPTKHIFDQLGLSIDGLQAVGAVEQLDAISKAMGRLPNQAQRAAAATGIFGRAGAEMLALFANPDAIKSAGAAVGDQAAIYERTAGRFAKLTNVLDSLSKKVKGFFLGFADQVTPILLPMLDKLKSALDFVTVGEKIGARLAPQIKAIGAAFTSAIATGQELFARGKLGETAWLMLKVGFGKAINFLASGIKSVFAGLATMMVGVVTASFASLNDKTFWTGLQAVFQGLADIISSAIANAIASALQGITVLGHKLMPDEDAERLHGAADLRGSAGRLSVNAGLGMIGDSATGENLIKAMQGAIDSAKITWKDSKPVWDVSKDQKELSKLLEGARAAVSLAMSKTQESADKVNNPALTQGLEGVEKVKKMKVDGDRLAKMGLFIGGGGPAANRYAQDTARNTRETNLLLKELALAKLKPSGKLGAFA